MCFYYAWCVFWMLMVEQQTQSLFCCCFLFLMTSNFGAECDSCVVLRIQSIYVFLVLMWSRQENLILYRYIIVKGKESIFFFFFLFASTRYVFQLRKPRIAPSDHQWTPFGFYYCFSDSWDLPRCRCHYRHPNSVWKGVRMSSFVCCEHVSQIGKHMNKLWLIKISSQSEETAEFLFSVQTYEVAHSHYTLV